MGSPRGGRGGEEACEWGPEERERPAWWRGRGRWEPAEVAEPWEKVGAEDPSAHLKRGAKNGQG